jgi:hypothetical protein
MESSTWLSEADLIACAAQHEPDQVVTRRQLERWRKNDLIPRPKKRSLGRARGFRSAYPPGTCEQLVALIHVHRTERRLHCVRFALWCQGFPIPREAVKKTLDELAFRPIRSLRSRVAPSSSVEDVAANVAALAMPNVPRSKVGRTIRGLP